MIAKQDLINSIHNKCMDCCSNNEEDVINCTASSDSTYSKCPLWEYRLILINKE